MAKTEKPAKPFLRTDEELRKDFELGLMFPGNHNGLDVGEGSLRRDREGNYKSPTIQAAWTGYRMYAKHAAAQLERTQPDRFLTNGHYTQFRELISDGTTTQDVTDEWCDFVMRAALRVANGSPA